MHPTSGLSVRSPAAPLLLLTCALLMTSSHSEGHLGDGNLHLNVTGRSKSPLGNR